MPLRFWKKERPEKGTEDEAAEEIKEAEEKAPSPEPTAPRPAPEAPKPEVSKVEPKKVEEKKPEKPAERQSEPKPQEKAAPPAEPPKPGEADGFVNEAHAGLVELGLTVPPTKAVFAKRVAAYPGGEAAFVLEYRAAPYRAITRVLIDWLGFRVSESFDPKAVIADVNLRLSSFKLNVGMKDVSWLDQELNLRKAKLSFGDQERIVRFKDARDLMKGVNEMLAPRKIAFLELETWTDDFAFLLAREPKWDKLSREDLVVVKADQTAKGGECGECGAPVGKYWSDCLKCGAVFG